MILTGTIDWRDGNNGQVKWALNFDFSGFDIWKQLSTGEECGGICLANPSCTHFTWGAEDFCFMKSAQHKDSERYSLNAIPSEGAVCGYIVYRNNSAFSWQDGEQGLVG